MAKYLLRFLILLLIPAAACRSPKILAPADNLTIVPRAGWNAAEARPYKQQVPVRITIHHEGTKLELTDDAARKIRNIQTWGMGPDRKWADIPYHFLISPGGTVYEGRDVYTVGETNTEYDPSGHLLICCLGNLEEQPVTSEQLTALVKTVAWAAKRYQIPVDSIAAHKDYSRITTCPGKNLYVYLRNGYIKEEVRKRIKGN
ncbi:MAG TPA: peptidoglycan recognition family protein [Chitinophagaceae bacterium]